jgi:hypothetical protein
MASVQVGGQMSLSLGCTPEMQRQEEINRHLTWADTPARKKSSVHPG